MLIERKDYTDKIDNKPIPIKLLISFDAFLLTKIHLYRHSLTCVIFRKCF